MSPLRNEAYLSNEVAQGVAALWAEIYRHDCHGLKAFMERGEAKLHRPLIHPLSSLMKNSTHETSTG